MKYFTKQVLFDINFTMSQQRHKRTTRSSKNNFLIEEEVMPNSNSMKKADKFLITSYSLKSRKLKEKRLTTL